MNQARLKNIDALRGIAAIMVVFIHYTYQIPAIASFGKYGYLGVHIFFVISGFVLPYALHKSAYEIRDFFRFLLRRILRIDPPYLIATVVAIVLPFLNGRGILSWQAIVAHIGYLNGILDLPWASGVFWTLAIEFQFYVVLGILYKAFVCRSNLISVICLISLLALSLLFRNSNYITYWFAFFGVGILLFRVYAFNLKGSLFLVAWIMMLAYIYYFFGIPQLLATIFASLFIRYVNISGRVFWERWVLWIGTISYSLYLIHIEIGKVLFKFSPTELENSPVLKLLIFVVIALGIAWTFHLVVERPALRLSKRINLKDSI